MNDHTNVLTVDGSAASGKGTATRIVAEQLNLRVLDTGSIYRTFAWLLCVDGGIPVNETRAIIDGANNEYPNMVVSNGHLLVRGEFQLGQLIRTPEVSELTPHIAKIPQIRELVRMLQLRFISMGGEWIVEGRDIGSAVFPQARCKVFLTASLSVRAQRRYEQYLSEQDESAPSYAEVLYQMIERDHLDATREHSPMVCPNDALHICTDRMDPIKTSALIIEWWKHKKKK